MTPLKFSRNIQNLNRLRLIATTLTQHGFGHVVDRIDLSRFVPVWMLRKKRRKNATDADESVTSIGRRLAQVCSDLGPTFVKLGQLISSRPDAAPPEVLNELKKLQDEVPAFDGQTALDIISAELGRPIDSCFEQIETKPIASGSIGQVHRATLKNGVRVVIKVRRPGVEETIAADIQLLRWLAENIESVMPELKVFQPVMLVDELHDLLTRELDYINEASATQKFGAAFQDEEAIQIPKVFWDLTASRVLTLEELHGSNIEKLEAETGRRDLESPTRPVRARPGGSLSQTSVRNGFVSRRSASGKHPVRIKWPRRID